MPAGGQCCNLVFVALEAGVLEAAEEPEEPKAGQ